MSDEKLIEAMAIAARITTKHARAALAVVRREEGWRPIETAPKDGTLIDLWIARADGKFPARREPECKWIETFDPFWMDCAGLPAEDDGWRALAWRPLPTPPEGGRDGD